MFQLPGGWEFLLIIVVVAIVIGGPKALDAMKKGAREAYKAKKEVDSIKDDITGK
jgi:Sec-independent protein translocase protein TatA